MLAVNVYCYRAVNSLNDTKGKRERIKVIVNNNNYNAKVVDKILETIRMRNGSKVKDNRNNVVQYHE